MDYTTILVNNQENGLAIVQFNRPDIHNAFDEVFIRELNGVLESLNNQANVRVVLLKSSGKSFSAGADLNWMQRMAGYSWSENYQDSLSLATLMQTLASMSKPTIAAVQGSAFGGGVGLVACCDIAVCAPSAQFCLSEVKLGLIPAVISPYVIAAIGARAANRYFVTAERFTAETALRLGLVHDIVEAEKLDAVTITMAEAILANGPNAVSEAKRLIKKVAGHAIDEEIIRHTATKIADIRASTEGREGITAFLEKRTPDWGKTASPDLGD